MEMKKANLLSLTLRKGHAENHNEHPRDLHNAQALPQERPRKHCRPKISSNSPPTARGTSVSVSVSVSWIFAIALPRIPKSANAISPIPMTPTSYQLARTQTREEEERAASKRDNRP